MPILRSAQALPSVVIVINPHSVELSESNSHLKSQCPPQKLVLILPPHIASLPVYIFQFLQILQTLAAITEMLHWSRACGSLLAIPFLLPLLLFLPFARRQLTATRALPPWAYNLKFPNKLKAMGGRGFSDSEMGCSLLLRNPHSSWKIRWRAKV